jgi:hypothetical protein
MADLAPDVAAYLRAQAEATQQTPGDIVTKLVRKELASA